MGEPTHLQAADELASRAGTLADIANAERPARAARRALASQSPTGAGVETGDGGAA